MPNYLSAGTTLQVCIDENFQELLCLARPRHQSAILSPSRDKAEWSQGFQILSRQRQ